MRRLLFLFTFFSYVKADCRNIANIAPVAQEHVVDVLFQIAAENQFGGIENGRLLVTPNVDLAAALAHTQINTAYLNNGNYKHWVKTWVSLTKRDLSLTQIENLFDSITPTCSFQNMVQYFEVDTDICLGYRDTTPPCDFAGNEGCKNLYDIDVTYTMCFMRNNQTDNCVPFDEMPDFWDRNTQTTIWTDEYICVRNADNSKEVELEYVEPSVYVMRKNSTLDYGSFVSIPPIETRQFAATFCSEELDEEGQAALVAATQAALAELLGIDPGNLVLSFDNLTSSIECAAGDTGTRRRLDDDHFWGEMEACSFMPETGDCQVKEGNCHVHADTCDEDQECDCACEVEPNEDSMTCTYAGLHNGECQARCDEDGVRIEETSEPTHVPSPEPTQEPTEPTPEPTEPTPEPTEPTPEPTPEPNPTPAPVTSPTTPPPTVPAPTVPAPTSPPPTVPAPTSPPPPTPKPTSPPLTTASVGGLARVTDVSVAGNNVLDRIGGVGQIDKTAFGELVKENGGQIAGVENAGIIPREEDDWVAEDAPSFDLSYWEMVAFVYGLYYVGFLLLEVLLVFSKDYYELTSITTNSRRFTKERYIQVQNRNRDPANELTIFRNLCGHR